MSNDLTRALEAWIRHGEAVPADVTTYDRGIVHVELRAILANHATDPVRDEETALLERLAARAARNAGCRTGPDADHWSRTATWLMGHTAQVREIAGREPVG